MATPDRHRAFSNWKLHLAYCTGLVVFSIVALDARLECMDRGVTLSYRDGQVQELDAALSQLMAALPSIANSRSKAAIVDALEQASGEDAWEKDGCIWVGRVGLQFTDGGELRHATPAWTSGDRDPCHGS